ncbi:unnamed protein product [Calypogeia fissa]
MDFSMISDAELPRRKYEIVDTRNGVISSGYLTDGEQRNYRDDFHVDQMACWPGSFHDMLPDMREFHSEATLYGHGHVQGRFVHHACSRSGCQQPELFYDDHDHGQGSSHKSYCHGVTGSSTPIRHHHGHPNNLCDCGCRGSAAMRRERSGLANCMVGKTGARSRSSSFVDSLEFERNFAAVDGMSNLPWTRREAETRNSSLDSGFMANSVTTADTNAPLKQIMLYGWYLMKPPRGGDDADPSTISSVAIGGYRCPQMREEDFIETGTVVERLERWKLRTSDGLEVGLMGMINIDKSVASGFSPSVVQCFMIGFPSAWVYMLLNMQKGVPKSSSGMPSPSASPTSSAGPPGVIGNKVSDCRGTPTADLVQSILHSPLFTAGPDVKTKMATLGRSATAATTPTSPIVDTRDKRKRPRSELDAPVADIPLVDPVVAPADSFHSSERPVSPDVTEEKADAEPVEELENEDSIIHKDDVDVEVNQSCKVRVEGRPRARRKRYTISRNYYQRGKKKSSTKIYDKKVPPGSDKSTSNVKIHIESTKVETDESQVVEEMIDPPRKKVDRPKSSSSLEGPESSVENSQLKASRQTKKPIVPPLPPPRVADKSKVTEAFGLKKSLHGRVLVPPLATWRNQSIKYDQDGGIIAISDGFIASEDESCTGYYNFKPPADKGARTMQRRLCEAADKGYRKK